jgi:hypothetical protein
MDAIWTRNYGILVLRGKSRERNSGLRVDLSPWPYGILTLEL